jgi:hypothetical protein
MPPLLEIPRARNGSEASGDLRRLLRRHQLFVILSDVSTLVA